MDEIRAERRQQTVIPGLTDEAQRELNGVVNPDPAMDQPPERETRVLYRYKLISAGRTGKG